MTESLSVECPHCGETFRIALDPGEGSAEFTYDCEICCRPMKIQVEFDEAGQLAAVTVEPE